MTSQSYLLPNEWRAARERLALLEHVLDPGTIAHLDVLGVRAGWQCLELGGGGGSIARWLCDRVGTAGRVVATDLDTRFLEHLECPRLEVWRHDVGTEDLPEAAFDLIHTRALLCHVPEREGALDRITRALRPGGWLLIEEPDYTCEAVIPPPHGAVDLIGKFSRAKDQFLDAHGFDRFFGRRVFQALTARGFVDVTAHGRVDVSPGGTPPARFYQMTMQQSAQRLSADGNISESEIEAYCALLDDPAYLYMWPMMLATSGRRADDGAAS